MKTKKNRKNKIQQKSKNQSLRTLVPVRNKWSPKLDCVYIHTHTCMHAYAYTHTHTHAYKYIHADAFEGEKKDLAYTSAC